MKLGSSQAMRAAARWASIAMLGASLSACVSFSTVRSAVVTPGPAFLGQASIAAPPGDEAAWFWSFDCADTCDHAIPGGDVFVSYGWAGADSGRLKSAIGAGVNGTYPYLDGYAQLRSGTVPFGLGARLGIPAWSWTQHQLYGRFDFPIGDAALLWNPALLYHTGNSPNGGNPGSFLGIVQGIGFRRANSRLIPSVAVVVGRSERTSDLGRIGPRWRAFATVSVSVVLERGER